MIERNRIPLWLTFMIGTAGVVMLAVNPVASLDFTEFGIIICALLSAGIFTAEEFRKPATPYYGYLLSGLTALYTSIAFNFTNNWEALQATPMTLLLLAFGVGGIAEYVLPSQEK